MIPLRSQKIDQNLHATDKERTTYKNTIKNQDSNHSTFLSDALILITLIKFARTQYRTKHKNDDGQSKLKSRSSVVQKNLRLHIFNYIFLITDYNKYYPTCTGY